MDELTLTDLAAGVTLAIVYTFLAVLLMGYTAPDFTDTGVGCVEDCLDVQDEADAVISKERN